MADQKEKKRQKLRKIEAKYKQFGEELASLNRDEEPDVVLDMVTGHIEQVNQLYPEIKKKLVGSAADAKHIKNLLKLSKATAKRINTPVKFDVGRALRSLKRELGDPQRLKDNIMNECVKKCFMVAPTFEYFYGRIKQEGLEVKQKKKRIKLDNQDKNLVAVRAAERNLATECEQDSTPKEVEAIYERVKNLIARGTRSQSVGLIRTLVDPNSFSQTVENIFHTAFLVKEGKLGVKRDRDNKPTLTHEATQDTGDEPPTQRRERSSQSIFSFSMKEYRKWVEHAASSRPRPALTNHRHRRG